MASGAPLLESREGVTSIVSRVSSTVAHISNRIASSFARVSNRMPNLGKLADWLRPVFQLDALARSTCSRRNQVRSARHQPPTQASLSTLSSCFQSGSSCLGL